MARRPALPFSLENSAHSLAVATVAVSVVSGLMRQSGSDILSFAPARVLSALEVWRPFTSLFVASNPLEVIFGALIIYSIGGILLARWGRKTFLRLALGIPLTAEAIVLVLALVAPESIGGRIYTGTGSVLTTLWILYGLMSWFSGQMLNFWGTPISGKTFALIGLGFVVLSAVFGDFRWVLPDLISAGLCYAYMYRGRSGRLTQRIELAYYSWKLERLKKRSKLRVVKGSRDDDSDPSSNIH